MSLWRDSISNRLRTGPRLETRCKPTPLVTCCQSKLTVQPHTCQCTQCRKTCGSLIYNFHSVVSSELTFLSKTTYAEYESTPGFYRTFCRNCGSPISWVDGGTTDIIELAVGAFDEKYLVGEREGEEEPIGGFGIALANPEGDCFHVRNEIKGVTDEVGKRGTRFWKGTEGGPMPRETSQ